MAKDKIKYFIGMETLAANAFIKMMDRDSSSSEQYVITIRELEAYGKRVLQILNRKGKQAVLVLSKEDTEKMFKSASEYFIPTTTLWGKALTLKKGVTLDVLNKKFRTYLPSEVLAAFIYTKI